MFAKKHIMKKIYIAVLLFLVISTTSLIGQCLLTPVSLNQRVNSSQFIIEGKVVNQKSFWNAHQNYIYTSNLIQVNQNLKGNINSSFIEVITEGGEVDLSRITVEPSLQLAIDQQGVFMLTSFNLPNQFGYPVYQVYSDQQGFVKFDLKENSARDPFNTYQSINSDLYKQIGNALGVMLADFNNPNVAGKFSQSNSIAAVTSISPLTLSAGTQSVLTITGTGFGTGPSATNYVEFRNADDGGSTFIQPYTTQYVSWTSTQIQVMLPTRVSSTVGTAGTGQVRVTTPSGNTLSAQSLTVNYGHLNVYSSTNNTVTNTRHVNLNSAGGITWRMFTGFDGNAAAKASFLRAFQTWRCGTFINWALGSTTSVNTIALDGTSIIRFDVGTELPVGVLGRCTSYFSGCTLGPNTFFYISELDIVFDSGTTWQYGPALAGAGQMDFESVALHELGHGHQLSHVINSTDVMHYSIGPAQNKRTLVANNLTAGNAVMTRNLSGGVCSQGVMTALNATTCIVAVPTATFAYPNPVCVGQTITFTNNSTGSPTSNSWTITGGSPNTSTVYNPSTTYAAAGVYSITLIATNGLGSSAPLTKTISVLASPNIVVTSATICPGKSATLTASGSTAGYTWTPGNLVGASQSFSPISTQVYNVVGSNGTCTNSSTGTITVLPGANPAVPNAFICAGSPTLMTATGATTYTWNPGNLNGSSQTFSPMTNTTYTVRGTVGTCTGSTVFTINTTTVIPVSISPSTSTLCAGQTTVLTASGASSYTWNTTATTSTILASAAVTTTYSVIGKTGNCQGSATSVVNIATCSGISSNEANLVSSIYPNPTEGAVTIKLNTNFSGLITVYNSLGQLVTTKTITDKNQVQLDIINQPNGIYILKLKSDSGIEKTMKIVKE